MQNITKVTVAKIPVLTLILSSVVAWFLVPITSGFPMVPFVVLFISLSTLVYVVRKNRSWFDTVLYLGILGLSFFLILRANEAIQFITFLFIIVFGSLLILPLTQRHTLPLLFLTPFSMVKEALTRKTLFPYSWNNLKKFNKTNSVKRYLPSILVTILFLGITIPLLASANPFFSQMIQNILSLFNITQFVHFFQGDQIPLYIVRLGILIFLSYSIPRVLTASFSGTKINEVNLSLPVNYLIPKVAMGLLLIVFFVTQAQLYFATPGVLQSMGYTNSRLTNEVFFQVTIVAFIIFFLAYLDKERKNWNKRLTYLLILEAFFLVGIAFKSVFDYSFIWGLTEKRLWGYATMSWLTGALLLFLYYYKKQIPLIRFFQFVITYTVVVLLSINIVNFDYLISHYSKARTQSGTDYIYLAKLSPDARYYKETLKNLIMQIEESETREYKKLYAAYDVLGKIDNLKRKYNDNTPQNSFNLSEYTEYLSIRDIDTDAYYKRLSEVGRKYNEQEKSNSRKQSVDMLSR